MFKPHFVSGDGSLKIGTWNVRGINNDFKKRSVFEEIAREDAAIVVLSETKLRETRVEEHGDYVHFSSGYKTGRARAGVSIIVKKHLCGYGGDRRHDVSFMSNRLIVVRLQVRGHSVVIVGVYGVDEDAKQNTKNEFWAMTESVIAACKNEEIIILGDFNARIGSKPVDGVVGGFGKQHIESSLIVKNNNGVRLVQFCSEHKLKIQNTFFEHDAKHIYSWHKPNSSNRTLIDYFITKQETSICVIDVLFCRWYNCDTTCHESTDHLFLEAVVTFLGVKSPPVPALEIRKYDTVLLYSEKCRNAYQRHLDDAIWNPEECSQKTTSAVYENVKNSIHNAASLIFNSEEIEKFFFDCEARDILANRRKIYNENHPSPDGSEANAQKRNQVDKNEVWKEICNSFENISNKMVKISKIQCLMDELRGNNDSHTTIQEFEKTKNYFQDLYRQTKNNLKFCKINSSNKSARKINVSTCEVDSMLNEYVDDYYVSPGGVTINLLKYSSIRTKKLLAYLIQRILNGDDIPIEVGEATISFRNGIFSRKEERFSYHPIMVIMETLLEKRLNTRPDKYTICDSLLKTTWEDATFMIRQLLQKNSERQTPQYYLAFLDMDNMFFDIPLPELFRTLHSEIDNPVFNSIIHLHTTNSLKIISTNFIDNIPFVKCLRKTSLGYKLFSFYIKNTLREWSMKNAGIDINGRSLCGIWMDDRLVIVAQNHDSLASSIKNLEYHVGRAGFKVFKTCDLKYLTDEEYISYNGLIFQNGGQMELDVQRRFLNAKNVVGVLHTAIRDNTINIEVKRRIFYSIVVECLLHGCETWIPWTMTQDMTKMIDSVEVLYWKNHFENLDDTYRKLQISEIRDQILSTFNEVETISKIIEHMEMFWYVRVMKMKSDRWVRCLFEWTPKAKRKSGANRKKREFNLEKYLQDELYKDGSIAIAN